MTLPTLKKIEVPTVTPITLNLPDGYIPRDKRKKILLLSDDLRMPSGVGVMSREIVMGTAHKYNWIQLGAGINHPEVGKIMDASTSLGNEIGIPDAYLKIFPYNGYGDATVIRNLIMMERPNAILHFTDPRYWVWLYHMEAEIRELMPIMFYHVWDDLPFPKYNQSFYRSCDYIANISRQTYNIVKNVWKKEPVWQPWQVQYIGHGVNENIFRKLTTEEELKQVNDLKIELFGNAPVDFVVLYNNRNIRRKNPGDVVLAYYHFIMSLPEEKRDKCRLLFHTQAVDDNGTDIPTVIRDCAPEIKYAFTSGRMDPAKLNLIYNISDVVINLASNEGFGLSTLEALMAEKLIVANVTGGLQDQMGFRDEKGNLIHEDIHFTDKWGSNHNGKYKSHGEWVFPVFPSNLSLVGSPPTPYIFDDRCRFEDAGDQLKNIYALSKEEREQRGQLGRKYCLENNFTSKAMANKFIDGIERTFQNWKPRKRFDIFRSE